MFAVIQSGGRQYKVSVGQQFPVNRPDVEDGAQIRIEEVLLISDEGSPLIGAPFVKNAAVLATAVKHARGEKVIVFRYKSKKRFRHKRGHRQELTFLKIDDIIADGKSLVTGEEPRAKVSAPDEGVATGETAEMTAPVETSPEASAE